MRALLGAVTCVLALALAGCGSTEEIDSGGRVVGDTLTVFSLLPLTGPEAPAARDIVDGEKLALAEAGGRAGALSVNFSSLDEAGSDPEAAPERAASVARTAINDGQIGAAIGSPSSATAMTTVPLFNEAGVLQVSPGAGYAGFAVRVQPGEPQRFYPSGRRTFARLGGDDRAQARVLLQAIRAASGRRSPRILVEREPGDVAESQALELMRQARAAGMPLVTTAQDADGIVYAGDDVEAAAALASDYVAESPRAYVAFGDDLARAGVERRLEPAAARRTLIVSRAPAPGSNARLRAFEAAFERTFDRRPGTYAALGYEAMASTLAAIARAGDRAHQRQEIINSYFAGGERDSVLGRYRLAPDGTATPPSWSVVRRRGGRREQLPLAAERE